MIDHTLNLSLDKDRHLIVGDVHGRYDIFMRLLKKANYDPTKDIVYCVGDMIDRGDKSFEVFQFFQQDRCYSVKGNHELMMLDSEWMSTWLSNGGVACLHSLEEHKVQFDHFKDMVRDLPWVIDVGDEDEEHAFRIVHAEQPAEWSDVYFKSVLDSALNADDPGFARLVWGRVLATAARNNINNLKPAGYGIDFHPARHRTIFTGHTPIKKATKCGDTWMLDTWASKSLTLIDAITEETFVETYS